VSQTKTSRWLDLLAYLLQHRYPVTREQIFASVGGYETGADSDERARESARRKFERDKDDLRALGVDIQTVAIPGAEGDEAASGYRLAPRDFYLPYLELTEGGEGGKATGEGKGIAPYALRRIRVGEGDLRRLDSATRRVADHRGSPLAAAAASARRKLGFDLPLTLGRVETVLGRPLGPHGEAALAVLQRAVAERAAVSCRYFSIGRNTHEQRIIEPYGLFFSWSRWYCVARARDRDALRVFRVDRMRDAVLETGADARFTVPAGFSLRSYLGRAPWDLSDQPATPVRVRFAFPESRWVLSRGTGRAVEPVTDDFGALIEFAVRDRAPFLRWLLTFGQRASVETPDEYARELAALRRQVSALYGGAAS